MKSKFKMGLILLFCGFAFFSCGDREARASDSISAPIHCDKFYNVFTSCRLEGTPNLFQSYEVQLDDVLEKVHSRFTFEYSFNCSDSSLPLFWRIGDTQALVATTVGWSEAMIEGQGDLLVFQSEDSRTRAGEIYFSKTCELILRNIKSIPSLKTVQHWRRQHADYTERVTDGASMLDKINKVLLYQEALDFIGSLSTMFLEELGSDTRQRLVQESSQILGDLDAMLGDAAVGLSEEQKQSLTNLRVIISDLANDDHWQNENGEPLAIADFLSPEDRETITRLIAERETPESLQQQRNQLMFRMNSWSEKIISLNNLLQQWETQPI